MCIYKHLRCVFSKKYKIQISIHFSFYLMIFFFKFPNLTHKIPSVTVDYPQYLMQEYFIFNFSPKVQLCYYDKLKIEASNTHECTQNCE